MRHKITVACGVFYEDQILMIEETQEGKKVIDIPAGGLDLHETLEDGVIREVKEETGVEIQDVDLVGVFQYIERERTTISFLYRSILNTGQKPDITRQLNDEEILSADFYPNSKIKSLLTNAPERFENPLAVARLKLLMNTINENDLSGVRTLNPIIIKS